MKKVFIVAVFVIIIIAIALLMFFTQYNSGRGNNIMGLEEVAIKSWLESEKIAPKNLKLLNINNVQNSSDDSLLFFQFESNKMMYQGVSYYSKEVITEGDIVLIADDPFTVHLYNYTVPETKESYIYVSGMINDSSIKYISIYYKNDSVVTLEPVNDRYYFDYSKYSIKEIVAYDHEYKEIYKY